MRVKDLCNCRQATWYRETLDSVYDKLIDGRLDDAMNEILLALEATNEAEREAEILENEYAEYDKRRQEYKAQ